MDNSQLLTDPRPHDRNEALLVGRAWNPAVAGPSIVAIQGDEAIDITAAAPTMRDLCEAEDPAGLIRTARGESLGQLASVLANTPRRDRDPERPWLLAPIDLQAIKAAGVTFVVSMLE
ncbi:MAG: fumarylacetoacetate hydrolase, partial [Pseudomonadota bacterium]|nr:fumarylacetoacetate hydrolase [Pseudomonadota bacterium]